MASSSRLIEPVPMPNQTFAVNARRVSHALVLYEPGQDPRNGQDFGSEHDLGSGQAHECDGARTLRLVEQAVDSMQALRDRADYITAQARDLIRLTNLERAQFEAELRVAREERARVEHRMRDAELALAGVNLRLREAELARREAELAARQAEARAVDAETRAQDLSSYLKKISEFLHVRLALSAGDA